MKIAACAICKNEEKNIPQWLSHTADFDYRIVVDTGSTDNTVKLLRDAGVSVVEKVFEPFRFDTARNFVLPLLPKETDWCVWPDFDEYYKKGWRGALEKLIQQNLAATRVTYKTFVRKNEIGTFSPGHESGTVLDAKIHKAGLYVWEKPIHEYLSYVGEGSEVVVHTENIERYHMHEPSKERQKLYFEIAQREVQENPDDEYATWFLLKDHYTFGDMEKSAEYAKKYLAQTSGNTDFRMMAKNIIKESEAGPACALPHADRKTKKEVAPDTVRDLIGTFSERKEFDAGIALARFYLKHFPNDFFVANELAGMLYQKKDFEEALEIAETLARLAPDDKGVSFNLAKCYSMVGRPSEASKLLKKLYDKERHNKEYALDYSLYLSGEGKFDESEAILRNLPPDDRVRFNLGWYENRKENFIEGFALRDHGRSQHLWGSEHVVSLPRERRYAGGVPLYGKTVFLFNEGGVGDEMIFARFAHIPKERGAKKVIVGCSPSLVPLFKRSLKGVDEVLPVNDAKNHHYDFYIPMMSAPNLLAIPSPTVPFPYLIPDPKRVAFWSDKLEKLSDGKPKIGIRWAGNPKFEHEQSRTISPKFFMELAQYGKLFSLQRDFGADWLPHNHGVHDLQHDLTDWDETLAVITNLDMVVSSCTSIVHVAGALNVPTCVIVPIAPYFTWAAPGEKSDWYPSATVFRQEKPREWREPFEKLHEFLSKKLSSRKL